MGVNGPFTVAQLLEIWISIQKSQFQMRLRQEKFFVNPKRFILRVASSYCNIILLSKEHEHMRYIIFRKLNIERV